VSVEGGGHGDFDTPETSRRMRQFFDKHLLGKDEAISTEPIKVGTSVSVKWGPCCAVC
jgi:hypothetical protein